MGDVVSLTGGTATFSDKNVGNGKVVTLTGASLSGADAGNYVLDSVATTTANITAKHITGSFTADNKEYDGNDSATVLTRSLSGTIMGDVVSLTGGTATFADKNVGIGKVVTLTGASLTGADAGNYVLDSVATTTANITAKHITGSFTADNKEYDGNDSATVLTRALSGTIMGDVVSLTGGTATFADKNVGIGKVVTLTGASLSGMDAGNYILDSVATATANITAKHITGSFTADNKEYDGNTSATVLTRALSGTIMGDVVSLTGGTATFADKNVGMGKTVTLTGASLSGLDAGNYVLDSVATTTANITALHITGSFTADNKVYDGNNSATVLTRSLSGTITGDVVSLTGGTATFSDKNVGTGKTVTLTGANLGGTDAGNYVLDSVATTTADITVLHITGTFTADSKVYDGNASATVLMRSLVGAIGGDAVSLTGGTASFDDKNVGTGKVVTLTGASLSGLDAGNYVLDSVATATADITALHITGTFTADTKVYDGNSSATVLTRSLVGAIGGDAVSLTGGTATFSDKNVGTGKVVTLTGASLTGGDSGNYVLDSVATTTADITALHITGTFTADNKVYDGNTSATVLTRSLTGTIMGDIVSLIGGTATFSDKNVGMGKTVMLTGASLSGLDSGNYVLDSVATATANITAATVTASIIGNPTKTYDGNTSATQTSANFSLSGVVSGESFTVTQTVGTYNSKDVATATTVTASLSSGQFTPGAGTLASNYVLPTSASGAGHIIALHITGSFTADNKVYDGNNSATVLTRSLSGTIMGDVVSLTGGTATFSDKNVGTGKVVTLTGTSLSGADAGDYVLDSVATATANITAATVTASIVGNPTKTYNGNTSATLTSANFSLSGVVSGESFTVTQTVGTYNSKDVATATTVTASLSSGQFTPGAGTLASNYVLPTSASGPGHITPASLTITATNRTKTFGATYTPNMTYPSPDFTVGTLYNGDSVASITLTCPGYAAGALPGSPYTITPSAAVGTGLGNYTIGYVTGQLTIGYGTCTGSNPGGVILPPINSDGTSVYKRQGGSTIPVKFTVCDANGNPISDPSAVFAGTGGQLTMLSDVRGQVETINEVGGTDIPDAAFRWAGGIWIFNMATNNLQSGHQYTFRINLKNGSGIQFVIGIK